MNPTDFRTMLIIGSVIFNAGGFVWLARNHFHSVNKRLDAIEARLRDIEINLARLNGDKRG